jgi:nucleoside-diphosphate-sugar epimerase
MRVFVTGASGHIGSAVVPELLAAGHQVVGLARSDSSADALTAAGAEALRGDLDDPDLLGNAASGADGVIHLAFKHEEMRSGDFLAAIAADLSAIEAIGAALEGSGKPFVSTSGTLMLTFAGITDRPGNEHDALEGGPRVDAENYVIGLAERGVRSSIVRLPPLVHSTLDHHGFGPTLIAIAREKGVSGYVGDGSNRWPAVHTLDAARVYRLALEEAAPGTRLHAVADEGVPFQEIAAAIGGGLGMPSESIAAEDAAEHFSFLGPFVSLDNRASSALTREWLGWEPAHPGLIADLKDGHYFRVATARSAGPAV